MKRFVLAREKETIMKHFVASGPRRGATKKRNNYETFCFGPAKGQQQNETTMKLFSRCLLHFAARCLFLMRLCVCLPGGRDPTFMPLARPWKARVVLHACSDRRGSSGACPARGRGTAGPVPEGATARWCPSTLPCGVCGLCVVCLDVG